MRPRSLPKRNTPMELAIASAFALVILVPLVLACAVELHKMEIRREELRLRQALAGKWRVRMWGRGAFCKKRPSPRPPPPKNF